MVIATMMLTAPIMMPKLMMVMRSSVAAPNPETPISLFSGIYSLDYKRDPNKI